MKESKYMLGTLQMSVSYRHLGISQANGNLEDSTICHSQIPSKE